MKAARPESRKGDLYRIVAAVAAAVGMIVLTVVTQPVDPVRHGIILAAIGQLQRDEIQLGEEVLRLRFRLLNNYDEAAALGRRLRDGAREMRRGRNSADIRADAEFSAALDALDRRLAAKLDGLERFKSANSVLKNSLSYLPSAQKVLQQGQPGGQLLRDASQRALESVLLLHIDAAEHGEDDVTAAIAALEGAGGRLPSTARDRVGVFLKHVKLIVRVERKMPELLQLLTSVEGSGDLAEAYRRYYDGRQRWTTALHFVLLALTLLMLSYAVSVFRQLRRRARELQLAASVFTHANECITITDADNRIVDVNPAFSRVTGYAADEVVGRNPSVLSSGRHDREFYAQMWASLRANGHWQGEIWNRRKNGEVYPEWLSISTVFDASGSVVNRIGSFFDISERKQSEAEINNLAFYDPLTQLPNRRLLLDRLRHTVAAASRTAEQGAVLFIDLDHFKTINDTQGHARGDQLLLEVARRLNASVRQGDTVARLGGDEFVVMLEKLGIGASDAVAQAGVIAEKILAELRRPYELEGGRFHSTASIGISLFRGHDTTVDELLKRADMAMYGAKTAGRNTVRFFDPAMQWALEERTALEAELRVAVSANQFAVYYQVQVDAANRPIGAEALLRWQNPGRGAVAPEHFIPLAEDTGLILPIGQWILEQVCAQLKAWEVDPHARELQVAVNVSAHQFRQPDFVARVMSALERAGAAANRLKLELTESAVLWNVDDTVSKMRALREAGVRFSMDDFGTGYSSLAYLTQLPLDQLKIDRSFVSTIETSRANAVIVQTIINMSITLGIQVIAEGVETEGQCAFLEHAGCRAYQGFLFSKALPLEHFEALLREGTANRATPTRESGLQ